MALDPETTRLMLELQLEDTDELLKGMSAIPTEGRADLKIALDLLRDEINNKLAEASDRSVATKLARSTPVNHAALRTALREEATARDDQLMAMRLAGITTHSESVRHATSHVNEMSSIVFATDASYQTIYDNTLRKVGACTSSPNNGNQHQANNLTTIKSHTNPNREASNTGGKKKCIERATHQLCCACRDSVPTFDLVTASCGDSYCRECIVQLFERSTVDRELFPPRCCRKDIPLASIRDFVDNDFAKLFGQKSKEFTTVNPLYCAERTCSAFVPPESINAGVGTCSACSSTTCTSCRREGHKGLCQEDPHVQALRVTAHQEGWSVCSRCKNMVELTHGCFHMTFVSTPQLCQNLANTIQLPLWSSILLSLCREVEEVQMPTVG